MTIPYFKNAINRIGLDHRFGHLPDGVKESLQITLIDVLDKIEDIVIARLEIYLD